GVRQDVAFAMEKFNLSERRACELNHMDRSSYRYQPMPDRNADLRKKLTALAREKPRWGYRRLGVLLEQKGETVNPKRLFRVYYSDRGPWSGSRKHPHQQRTGVYQPLLSRLGRTARHPSGPHSA